MVGYGPEDNNFVLELTYNYTVKKYDHGNDFVAIHIRSGDILKKARQLGCEIFDGKCLKMPDGYVFVIEEDSTAFSGNLKFTKITFRLPFSRNICYILVFFFREQNYEVNLKLFKFNENNSVLERDFGITDFQSN